jgi:hypothetical protein
VNEGGQGIGEAGCKQDVVGWGRGRVLKNYKF